MVLIVRMNVLEYISLNYFISDSGSEYFKLFYSFGSRQQSQIPAPKLLSTSTDHKRAYSFHFSPALQTPTEFAFCHHLWVYFALNTSFTWPMNGPGYIPLMLYVVCIFTSWLRGRTPCFSATLLFCSLNFFNLPWFEQPTELFSYLQSSYSFNKYIFLL